MALLAGSPGLGDAVESGGEWLMVRKDHELPPLEKKSEVTNCSMGGQQLSIKSTVSAFSRRQLLRKECQGPPRTALALLEDGSNVSC